jgi:hypothetical protein
MKTIYKSFTYELRYISLSRSYTIFRHYHKVNNILLFLKEGKKPLWSLCSLCRFVYPPCCNFWTTPPMFKARTLCQLQHSDATFSVRDASDSNGTYFQVLKFCAQIDRRKYMKCSNRAAISFTFGLTAITKESLQLGMSNSVQR